MAVTVRKVFQKETVCPCDHMNAIFIEFYFTEIEIQDRNVQVLLLFLILHTYSTEHMRLYLGLQRIAIMVQELYGNHGANG